MQTYQKLQSLSGNEFDRAYVTHMVKDHSQCVEKLQAAAQSLPDKDLQQFAAAQVPVLRDHYRQAQQLAQTLGIPASELQPSTPSSSPGSSISPPGSSSQEQPTSPGSSSDSDKPDSDKSDTDKSDSSSSGSSDGPR
jgi:hypothetical protein